MCDVPMCFSFIFNSMVISKERIIYNNKLHFFDSVLSFLVCSSQFHGSERSPWARCLARAMLLPELGSMVPRRGARGG